MRTETDDIKGILHTLGTVEAVLLSRICPVLSEQSVDCEEVLLVGGGRRLLLKSRVWSEDTTDVREVEARLKLVRRSDDRCRSQNDIRLT